MCETASSKLPDYEHEALSVAPVRSLFIGCVVFPLGFFSAIPSFAREKISVAYHAFQDSDTNLIRTIAVAKTKGEKRAEEQNIENTNVYVLQIFLYYNR